MSDFLERHRVLNCAVLLIRRYLDHHVARDSAALTYYLLFAIFPLLIFFNNLMGLLAVNIDGLLQSFAPVIPRDIVELLEQYLSYVSGVFNKSLMWFSLVFSLYFPYRAANALFISVRKAYGVKPSVHFLRDQFRVALFTLLFIVAIVTAILAYSVGDRALDFLSRYIYISDALIRLWISFRFILPCFLMFFVIALLYALALGSHRARRSIWPGVLAALLMWFALSFGYSLYVEHAARYSVIYGSIGTIIVLLLWLYLSAVMLIMGAEFNSVLLSSRKDLRL